MYRFGMYKSIVVGTDFSDTAAKAVDHAVGLAKAFGSTLHIVTAFRSSYATGMAATDLDSIAFTGEALQEAEEKVHKEIEERLAKSSADISGQGLSVETHAANGDPADALIETAEKVGADLIVVGNRRMSGMGRFVLGSVSNSVSHHARCSVLIVHTTENP
jgi:nucleotide-binding universal stress UspA family protein